ncbi:hypothetical protein ACYATM_06690 [Lactobacillaceae bacterium Scapto_B20]
MNNNELRHENKVLSYRKTRLQDEYNALCDSQGELTCEISDLKKIRDNYIYYAESMVIALNNGPIYMESGIDEVANVTKELVSHESTPENKNGLYYQDGYAGGALIKHLIDKQINRLN